MIVVVIFGTDRSLKGCKFVGSISPQYIIRIQIKSLIDTEI